MSSFTEEQVKQISAIIALAIGQTNGKTLAVPEEPKIDKVGEGVDAVTEERVTVCAPGGVAANIQDVNTRRGSDDESSSEYSGGEGSVSSGSVCLPVREISEPVRKVRFGSVDEVEATSTKGFFSTYVHTAEVRRFAKYLSKVVEMPIPRGAMVDLALVTHTTGTVPPAFKQGGVRIRALAVVGDAAAKLAVVSGAYYLGEPVGTIQDRASSRLSNAAMCEAANAGGLVQFVKYPAGVSRQLSKSTADAFEAVAGVLFLHMGSEAVERYLKYFKVAD